MPKPEDNIYDKLLTRAISEINELCRNLTHCKRCAHGRALPVIGSGHPLADIFLVKYQAQPREAAEGVAFFGQSGEAIMKGCQKLGIDPLLLYGTNFIKCAGLDAETGREHCAEHLVRELMIIRPQLLVVMGRDAMKAINQMGFPLAQPLTYKLGEIQRFTPTMEALITPEIDTSLSDPGRKTRFWQAFKVLGSWYDAQPPY